MSAGGFWRRSRARQEYQDAETLTATDRCDRCGARAYVRVLLPSRLELLFCAHHNRQSASALARTDFDFQGVTVGFGGLFYSRW